MNNQIAIQTLLNQVSAPGFCVTNGKITAVNPAAAALFLSPETELSSLLGSSAEDYARFPGGALYLTLSIGGIPRSAAVTRMEDSDLFVLDREEDEEAFQSMALISRELRKPLVNVITTAEQLLENQELTDPNDLDRAAKMNRGLMQLLRLVCNLSDVGEYAAASHMEIRDLSAFLGEIMEKADTLTHGTGIQLKSNIPASPIFCQIDGEQLERAVWNLLSNALKFTPRGETVQLSLSRHGQKLHLTVLDTGSGIAGDILSTLFRRYQRQPGIEDARFGLGLGMAIVRTVAANHGGTVLVEQPAGGGSRITMTLALNRNPDAVLRSPIFRPDYSGGWDHGLVELSDVLDACWFGDI